jgi:hypothetical protein
MESYAMLCGRSMSLDQDLRLPLRSSPVLPGDQPEANIDGGGRH